MFVCKPPTNDDDAVAAVILLAVLLLTPLLRELRIFWIVSLDRLVIISVIFNSDVSWYSYLVCFVCLCVPGYVFASV